MSDTDGEEDTERATLARLLHTYTCSEEPKCTDSPGSYYDRELADVILAAGYHTAGGVEWGVESRTFLDGPWDRIDDGRGWTNRDRVYTEDEARTEAAKRINGLDPTTWRRVISRPVGPWTAATQ